MVVMSHIRIPAYEGQLGKLCGVVLKSRSPVLHIADSNRNHRMAKGLTNWKVSMSER